MIVRGPLSSKVRSEGEELLKFQLDCAGLGAKYLIEHQFCERKWRLDFFFPHVKPCPLAVEVEGGSWALGRHNRGAGFEADCEKYNRLAIMGFRLIRVTTGQVKSGQALQWIESAIG